ncbi:MAG: L,D-transpeptidase family protein, partial [Bacteroidetes bacterium]|nr:L,D-transpeptidase family protein [Bacteroidota bacterium]
MRSCWMLIVIVLGISGGVLAQAPKAPDSIGVHLDLLTRFYKEKPDGLFWCSGTGQARELRRVLLGLIDSAGVDGLDRQDYIPGELRFGEGVLEGEMDSVRLRDWDFTYTSAALALGWDLLRGRKADSAVSYDGVSGLYVERDEERVTGSLAKVRTAEDLRKWAAALLPDSREYSLLRDSLGAGWDSMKRLQLRQAMNSYRWVHHFGFEKVIVVNIPSADLRLYVSDTLNLIMRIVAGQPSWRTPRFAGWCKGLVLYPYWNVPQRIAVQELAPLFRQAPEVARQMGLQVLDERGKVVDPQTVQWASYKGGNFPYRIRQTPGCLNALGVIKFDLTDPYNVYMHDTYLKKLFASSYRYYSHGCIRLEKPIELGKALLPKGLDTTYLLACYRNQKPVQ